MKKKAKKSEATIKISVFVTPEQKKALDAITEKTGAPITFTVRQALDAYLKGQKL
jgi:predicted DNA-binding protein